jgi:hypothetical protein
MLGLPSPLMLGGALVALLGAFGAGVTVEHWRLSSRHDREALWRSRAAVTYMERNMERAAAADATRDAALARTQAALRRARNAPQQPIQCPPGGDVRSGCATSQGPQKPPPPLVWVSCLVQAPDGDVTVGQTDLLLPEVWAALKECDLRGQGLVEKWPR